MQCGNLTLYSSGLREDSIEEADAAVGRWGGGGLPYLDALTFTRGRFFFFGGGG